VFGGRDDELARLRGFVGRARIFLIAGIGGIGKTALMARFASTLRATHRVAYVRLQPNMTSADVLAAVAAAIALPALAKGPGLEDSLVCVCAELDREPTVLCLDDLHLLPRAEATLLVAELSGRLTTGLVVCTSRERIGSDPEHVHTEVAGLGPDAARALCRDLLERVGHGGDEARIARIAEQSRGHPLLLRLLVARAHESPGAPPDETVQSALGVLVDDCSRDELDALERLACFGRPVDPRMLEIPAAVVQSLAGRCLLDRQEDGTATVHDVLREFVIASAEPVALARHHVRCADLLATSGEVTVERIRHLCAAGRSAEATAQVRAAIDVLFGRRAYHEFFALLRALGPAAEGDDRISVGAALFHAFNYDAKAAEEALERVAAPLGPTDSALRDLSRVRIALGRGVPLPELGRMIDAALPASDAPDFIGADLLALAMAVACLVCDRDAQRRIATAGLAKLRQGASAAARAPLWKLLYMYMEHRGSLLATASAAKHCAAAFEAIGDPKGEAIYLQDRLQALLRAGRPADRELAAVVATAARLPLRMPRYFSGLGSASVAWSRGHASEALRHFLAGRALRPRREDAHSGALACTEAGFAEQAALLREDLAAEDYATAVPWSRVIAGLAALDRGRARHAARQATAVLARFGRIGDRAGEAWASLVLAAAAVRLGDGEAAEEHVARALDRATRTGALPLRTRALLLRAYARLATNAQEARAIALDVVREACARGDDFLAGRGLAAAALAALHVGDEPAAQADLAKLRALADVCEAPRLAVEATLVAALLAGRSGRALDRTAVADPRLLVGPERLRALAVRGPARVVHTASGRRVLDPSEPVPAPEAFDLWLDATRSLAVVRGRGEVDLGPQPLLCALLRTLLREPGRAFSKDDLYRHVWKLPYDPRTRDPALYAAVRRLRTLLDPRAPQRFLRWNEHRELHVVVRATCMIDAEADSTARPRDARILDLLHLEGELTTRDVCAACAVSRVTAYEDLEDLRARGRLVRVGRGPGTRYRAAD
jgi:hypothetical protein